MEPNELDIDEQMHEHQEQQAEDYEVYTEMYEALMWGI